MMKMLRFEVKKVFSKMVNKIAFVILAAALFVVSFLAVGRVEYVDEEGNTTSGIAAARHLKNEKNQWAGYITDDVLSKVIERNAEINVSDEYLSKDFRENDKAFAKKQGFSDIKDMINHAFCSFQEYDYYRADYVAVDEVRELYGRRISNLEEWLSSGIVLTILGADGAGCAIQTGLGGWKSFYNMTYFQEYLLTIAGGYLGSLFILALSMLASAKTHSTVFAVTIPFIILFLPSFLNGISVLSGVLGLLPDQLLQISKAVGFFNLYQIGQKVVTAVPVIMSLYFVLYCISQPVLYHVYRRTEIK